MIRILLAFLVLSFWALPVTAQEEEVADFFAEGPEGEPTLDLQAIAEDESLSPAEKAVVIYALTQGAEEKQALTAFAGLSANCNVKKYKKIWPYEADCTLSATPTATKNLSELGVGGTVGAFCVAIGAATYGAAAPVCMAGLYIPVRQAVMPVLTQCTDRDQGTSISTKVRIDKPKKSGASAKCG